MKDFNTSYKEHIQRSNNLSSEENAERLSGVFDKLFIPLYLAGAVGMFSVLLSPFNTGEGTGSAFMAAWAFLYVLTFFAIFAHKIYLYKKETLVFLFPLFFMISALWSIQTEKTFLYSFLLLLNAVFAIYLARRVDVKNISFIIMSLIIVLCLCGLLASLLGFEATKYFDIHNRPTLLGTHPIKGFFFHKIMAGYFAGMAAFLCLILLKGIKCYALILFLFIFILLTGSSSGLVLFFAGIVLYMGMQIFLHFRISRMFFLLFLLALVGISILLFHHLGEYVLSLLNRDPTLTGRTLLWRLGIHASLDKFFLGWGYLGYNGTELARMDAMAFPEFNNYIAPHFHNSYIQYLVDAGWVWGLIFIGLYFYTLIHWYGKALETQSRADIAITCILLYMMISGIFIHTLGRYNDLSMIFFFYALSNTASNRKKSNSPISLRPFSV